MGLSLLFLLLAAYCCRASSLGEELVGLSREYHPATEGEVAAPKLEDIEAVVSDMARRAVVEFNKTRIDVNWYFLSALLGYTPEQKEAIATEFVAFFGKKYSGDIAVAYVSTTMSICWAGDLSCSKV
jgi:hypothetical protein